MQQGVNRLRSFGASSSNEKLRRPRPKPAARVSRAHLGQVLVGRKVRGRNKLGSISWSGVLYKGNGRHTRVIIWMENCIRTFIE